MIQGVGQGGLAKAAIEAALASMQRGAKVEGALARMGENLPGVAAPTAGPSFSTALAQGITRADETIKASEALPVDLLSGKVGDFHEVAGQLKQSELAFKFSLEVRNKLIDAYRETMRMSV
ncbi:MAG: flagellar hook-basal body complex protein FliE [Planctomycetes bacterium]|nr:flagellar hook-basal body complex protein FliE [Planctomycetota bacterium]